MVKNPNVPVRQALIPALSAATGLPVWHKKVPKDVTPVPTKYILLQSQTKQPTERSKECYEWQASINIDITFINPAGFSNTVPVDSAEEQVINAVEQVENDPLTGIQIPDWYVKDIKMINSIDLDAETTTQSIERRIITYVFWIWPIA